MAVLQLTHATPDERKLAAWQQAAKLCRQRIVEGAEAASLFVDRQQDADFIVFRHRDRDGWQHERLARLDIPSDFSDLPEAIEILKEFMSDERCEQELARLRRAAGSWMIIHEQMRLTADIKRFRRWINERDEMIAEFKVELMGGRFVFPTQLDLIREAQQRRLEIEAECGSSLEKLASEYEANQAAKRQKGECVNV